MSGAGFRLPAEWEPQDGVLLAWPHQGTDWAANLADAERCYADLVGAISRYERVLLLVPNEAVEAHARRQLLRSGAKLERVRFVGLEYDDTWTRDSGPVTLLAGNRIRLLDFQFTGWGGKFEASRDDHLVAGLVAAGCFAGHAHRHRVEFALEGGAIESDGEGTVLTTQRCLKHRHPELTLGEIEDTLRRELGCDRVLALQHGGLEGDDTDAHIDTLARFASPDHIVYQSCDVPGDPHYSELNLMQGELIRLRNRAGAAYTLSALPWTQPIHARDGRRLAASYANFLILDGAVLMPGYRDPADTIAASVLRRAFPGREVLVVDCRALIEQNGSLHCVTMQLPRGVLADA
jgi:agmatine/peptidylarginine deiminase